MEIHLYFTTTLFQKTRCSAYLLLSNRLQKQWLTKTFILLRKLWGGQPRDELISAPLGVSQAAGRLGLNYPKALLMCQQMISIISWELSWSCCLCHLQVAHFCGLRFLLTHCGWILRWASWGRESGQKHVFMIQPGKLYRIISATFHASCCHKDLLKFKMKAWDQKYCHGHF